MYESFNVFAMNFVIFVESYFPELDFIGGEKHKKMWLINL